MLGLVPETNQRLVTRCINVPALAIGVTTKDMTQAALEEEHPASEAHEKLMNLLGQGDVLVLTGAGVSTQSGIPDYRDERGEWKRQHPIQFRDFVGSSSTRRRYWARSVLGFRRLAAARPNRAHEALQKIEARGLTRLLVTQNVDRLHQAAGSRNVVDLHGRIDRVVCLGCGAESERARLQEAFAALNPEWLERAATIAPDGDADPGDVDYGTFRVVDCAACGGLLKPNVVFFGENVPKARVEQAMEALSRARSLLVVGSSLMVFSGFRFVRTAVKNNIPVAVVNRGFTRADPFAAVKLEGDIGDILSDVARRV